MRLAIVHYHLRRGGVTRVIENTLAALRETETEIVVLTGEPPANEFEGLYRTVDGLGYREDPDGLTPHELSTRLMAAARDALGGPPDLWHVHNPTLGKNLLVTGALYDLARHGARMLLQIHDFAEDGRPHNYQILRQGLRLEEHSPYFTSPNIHYAVLNGRDLAILQEAGFPENRVHLLPNPIPPPTEPTDDPQLKDFLAGRKLWLYPTRGIRRKNLGELILWSLLSDDRSLFGTTLTPENPQQRPPHDRWENFAQAHQLPVVLGLVDQHGLDFAALAHAAEAHFTSSIAEGFGLAFLEPWTYGKPLAGRNLPAITRDFTGIDLSSLYNRLAVPADWIDESALRDELQQHLSQTYQTYEIARPDDALDRAMRIIIEGEWADFGALSETLQLPVCERLVRDAGARSAISPPSLEPLATPAIIEANLAAIQHSYSPSNYADRLLGLYRPLLENASGALETIDGQSLLHAFLDPARFHLLRT